MAMRGLRERGQSYVINRLACGVFGLEVSPYGYPNEAVRVACWRQPVPVIGGIRLGPAMPPWVCTVELVGKYMQVATRGKTKGDALANAANFLHGLSRTPTPT